MEEEGQVKNYECDNCHSTRAIYREVNNTITCDMCKTAMKLVSTRSYVKRRPKNKLDFE